jgi:protein arginine kinase activator
MKDFRATGRMGCARCYTTFEPSMRELLRRVHGNSRHQGEAYHAPQPALDEKATILGALKERLRRAVESEQFELAADLRDRIRVME